MVAPHTYCHLCAAEAPKGSAEKQHVSQLAETLIQVQKKNIQYFIGLLCEFLFFIF